MEIAYGYIGVMLINFIVIMRLRKIAITPNRPRIHRSTYLSK